MFEIFYGIGICIRYIYYIINNTFFKNNDDNLFLLINFIRQLFLIFYIVLELK